MSTNFQPFVSGVVRRTGALLAAATMLAGTAAALASPAGAAPVRDVAQIRSATARFHDMAAATKAGYVPFQDVNGVTCIDEPGMGGMGVHLVNPTLIANPKIDPSKPEALVYAPAKDGTLHLAALEYLVVKADWDAQHVHAPQILRHTAFDETAAPNRFGLPDFYSQHVWAWQKNPAGLLSMWNPNVNCAFYRSA